MSELQVFNNAEFGSVRTMSINGEPYFVGKDVATILGYAKPLNALAMHVDEDDSLNRDSSTVWEERRKPSLSTSPVFTALFFQASYRLLKVQALGNK